MDFTSFEIMRAFNIKPNSFQQYLTLGLVVPSIEKSSDPAPKTHSAKMTSINLGFF
jgi:hypothetical protein